MAISGAFAGLAGAIDMIGYLYHFGSIDVLVLTAQQLADIEAQDNEDEPPQELRLLAPESKGFVLLRALARWPGEIAAAQARLAGIECSRQLP